MEKYRILMFGKNRVIINELFIYHEENLECLSCSGRSEDLVNHLKYIKPDALLYCMQEEDPDDMQQILIMRTLEEADIPLVIIGQEWECEEFQQYCNNIAELIVRRPISISQIQEKLTTFLSARRRVQIRKEDEARKLKKHILVIDDDPLMLKVMKENLHDDYEVATAINGRVAMKFLRTRKVDLIFLDYEMPDESGPEVLEQLSQNDATKDIPVIFLTGVKEREKIQKALALKPTGYLLKPIEREKLLEVLDRELSMRWEH